MPIPLAQLNTWSNQGATTTSAAAYAAIRNAVVATSSPLRGRNVDIFLQGSYGNSTNIYGDSDVDVVVLYGDTFYKDMSALPPPQQQAHELAFPIAAYHWDDLRNDVLTALRTYFGPQAVTLGNKAIKVQTATGRMTADVVPAMQFRRYVNFVNQANLSAYWGIQFFDASGNAVVNYPKYHISQGEAKNQDARTRGQYKPTIRIFKNFRNHLVARNFLASNIAPSYFIECLLHNVPDNLFIGQYTATTPAIIEYLWNTPYEGFLCQNGITYLFGTEPTQWSATNCARFLDAARRAWAS